MSTCCSWAEQVSISPPFKGRSIFGEVWRYEICLYIRILYICISFLNMVFHTHNNIYVSVYVLRNFLYFSEAWNIRSTLQGTNISLKNGIFEDDFPFPKVGYVNSLGGTNSIFHPQRAISSEVKPSRSWSLSSSSSDVQSLRDRKIFPFWQAFFWGKGNLGPRKISQKSSRDGIGTVGFEGVLPFGVLVVY